MKVTLEKLPASQVGFDIEVEGEKSQAIYDRIVKDLMRSMNVPGFRKGKAPKQLVLREVGSERLKANVLEDLLDQTLKLVLEEQKEIQAIGSFELMSPLDDLLKQFQLGQPFNFKVAIDVYPEVTLNNHQNLAVKAEKVEPNLAKVETTLHEFQVKNATLVPVEARGLEIGDVAAVDLKMLDENGVEIADAAYPDLQLEMDEANFLPELIRGIVGMKIDESREIAITLPADYYLEDYSGEPVTFVIALKDIKAKELPALDDDFAQSISEKQTIAELREFLENRYTEEAEDQTTANTEQALLDALVLGIETELPATLVKEESNFMIQQQATYLQRMQGGDKLLKQLFTKEFIGEMHRMNQPEAIARIKRTLALAELAKLENITAEPSEITARIKEYREEMPDQEFDLNRLNQVVADEVVKEKVMAWLKENSTIEFVPEGSLKPVVEDDQDDQDPTLEAEVEVLPEALPEPAIAATPEPVSEVSVEVLPETKAEKVAKDTAKGASSKKNVKKK